MNRFFILLVLCITVIACNNKKENIQDSSNVSALNDFEEINVDEKSNVVYISSDRQYRFSILSVQKNGENEKILLQNDVSGRIYDMKKVNSYTGERYLDEENYYFWINGETFSFGKGDDLIVEGEIEIRRNTEEIE